MKTIAAPSNVDYVVLKVDTTEISYPNNYSYSALRDNIESGKSNAVEDISLSP